MSIQFFLSLPQIGTVTEEDWLFETAVSFFNIGRDEKARDLFYLLARRGGALAASAQDYLEKIEYRCDELPFAKGVYLLNRGQYVSARRRFMEVVNIGRARKDEARDYLDVIETQLEPRKIEASVEEMLVRGKDFSIDKDLGFEHIEAESRGQAEEEAVRSLDEVEKGRSKEEGASKRVKIPPFANPPEWLEETAKPGEAIVRRTPHMDFVWPSAPGPGISFMVLIYADKTAPHDEESEEIEIEAPPDIDSFELKVTLLLSDHFVPVDDNSKTLTIIRDRELSTPVLFRVAVKSEEELAAQMLLNNAAASITALFTYNGRPSGKVRRKLVFAPAQPIPAELGLVGMTQEDDRTEVRGATEGRIEVQPRANSVDLNITIVADEDADGRKFWCTVQTDLLPNYAAGVTEKWTLPQAAHELVKDYMQAFENKDATPAQRILLLQGAGEQLFDASPKNFRAAIWELHDAGKLPKTISIVSEEPYIPWELMIPTRDIGGRYEEMDPLGVKFTVGRWPKKGVTASPQKISLVDSYVIAPTYPERPLKHAQEESKFVREKFNGVEITPATSDKISAAFGAAGKTLIHFACHGENRGVGQVILLDNEDPLQTFALRGMRSVRKALKEKKAIVFINACEVGRGAPSLVGVGGFARTFIDMGASAVIAPLWSVKDKIAHQVACEFYQRITEEPSIPFAEVFQSLRRKAYVVEDSKGSDATSGEDTYAAYCFYGDPLSSRAVN